MKKYIHLLTSFILSLIFISCHSRYTTAVTEPATAKIFAAEIERFDHLNEKESYSPNAVLFTGSSTIRLWSTIEEDMAPYKVIQRGFGGARIEDLAWYFKRIVYPQKFSAIAIFAGTNNITGSSGDAPIDSILHYTRIINQMIREKFPRTPIFWIAITPVNSRIKVLDKVHEMNQAWEKEFYGKKNIWFINTEDAFLRDQKPMGELFISDQLHLNREGYRYWSKIVKNEIAQHIKP